MKKGKNIIKQQGNLCSVYCIANIFNDSDCIERHLDNASMENRISFPTENNLISESLSNHQLVYKYLDDESRIAHNRAKDIILLQSSVEFLIPFAILVRTDINQKTFHRCWIFVEKTEKETIFIHILDTMFETMLRTTFDKFWKSYYIVGIAGLYNEVQDQFVAFPKADLTHLI